MTRFSRTLESTVVMVCYIDRHYEPTEWKNCITFNERFHCQERTFRILFTLAIPNSIFFFLHIHVVFYFSSFLSFIFYDLSNYWTEIPLIYFYCNYLENNFSCLQFSLSRAFFVVAMKKKKSLWLILVTLYYWQILKVVDLQKIHRFFIYFV